MMEAISGKTNVRIRPGVPQDAAEVAGLWRRTLLETVRPHYPDCGEEFDRFLARRTEENVLREIREDEIFLIAESGGKIAGFGCADFHLGLLGLYVGPEFQHSGIGTRLLHCLELAARAAGHRTLAFHATRNARSFYERMGYCAAGDFEPNGQLPCILMRKSLRH